MFIYANNIRKLVTLAQLVEQWTGDSEIRGSSPTAYGIRSDFFY